MGLGTGISLPGWGRVSRPQIQGAEDRQLCLGTAGWGAWEWHSKGTQLSGSWRVLGPGRPPRPGCCSPNSEAGAAISSHGTRQTPFDFLPEPQ